MNFKKKISIFSTAVVLILWIGQPLSAQKIRYSKPEKQGFSSKRLARITEFMESKVQDGSMVGGYGLIARNGKIIYEQDYGYSNRETQTKIDKNTLFRIYSMTKPVTAVALMILYEQGKFLLDDPIAKYIPELANLEVALSSDKAIKSISPRSAVPSRPAARQPTIRDLLTHTAGFSFAFIDDKDVNKAYEKANLSSSPTLKSFIDSIAQLPLLYDPGKVWHYSRAVEIQGYLIELLSGMPFSKFINTHIFEPLEMKNSFIKLPLDKQKQLATLYQFKTSTNSKNNHLGELIEASESLNKRFLSQEIFESGGGDMISTAQDYLRFCQMLIQSGKWEKKQILAPQTIQLMTQNHIKYMQKELLMDDFSKGLGFGFGFGVVEEPSLEAVTLSEGTFYWSGYAGTTFWIDPKENVIGIFMMQNYADPMRIKNKFINLSYQALVKSN